MPKGNDFRFLFSSEAIHRLDRVVREEEQRQEGGGGGGDLSPGETRKALPPPVKPRTRLSVDEGTMEEEEEGDSLTELPGRAAMVVGSVAAGAALEEVGRTGSVFVSRKNLCQYPVTKP